MWKKILLFCLMIGLMIVLMIGPIMPATASAAEPSRKMLQQFLQALEARCAAYGWTDIKPREIPWEYHRITKHKYPLVFTQFGTASDCVLFLGGVHGDELTTVYMLLKFAQYVKDHPALFQDTSIVIAPLVNPDGFFSKPPRRVNADGIDINRNFPTRDWHADAARRTGNGNRRNGRYYPGTKPGSEQETLLQMALLKRFRPEKILSVHSPLGFYDFDGPSADLDSFEHWLEKISKETNYPLKKNGYYPGSLGNYAGHERNIFTLTLELSSSAPGRGKDFFQQFQTAMLKFINLRLPKNGEAMRTMY